MAFTKEQRIQISKKIVQIPDQNKALDDVVANLDAELVKITNEDLGNKDLMDRITPKINSYQNEIKYLDGNVRTELVEQDMVDSANKIKQNFFFPNDLETPLPSIPDGIWKFLLPFSGNKAIGKDYTEGFGSIEKEGDILSNITSLIATIESNPQVERLSGESCEVEDQGSCDLSQYTNEQDCTDNGGTWTPNLVSVRGAADWIPDFNQLKTRVNDWKTILQNQKTEILAVNAIDEDATHTSENDIAIADIDNAIAEIDSWLAYQDFDDRSLPSDCSDFYNLDETDFDPAKLTSTVIQIIKDEVSARTTYIPTRISQVSGYLGSVGQDLNTGDLTGGGSGFYEERFQVINIRLNLLGGSLNKKLSTIKGKDAQGAIQQTNNNAQNTYASAIKVSKFRAPASNTGTIHVLDGSQFSPGDFIYVMADKQEELSGNIINVDGNTIFLDFNIPAKYTNINFGRIYKTL